ncbi:uncharacterized protein LOC118754131 [Rhagoletis pomonella]|uniref:uncharacterized protein LOC118754131 n=1 Tax=Rhagoletis pomonella TaxID=28610 RepID=UPI0017814CA2|nr:uncharacterized protein LOC118754131 [Rhagoletis pomonella]
MAQLNLRSASQSSILTTKGEVEAENYAPDMVEIDHTVELLSTHFTRFMDNHMVLVGAAKPEELAVHDALLAKMELAYRVVSTKRQRLRMAAKEDVASVRRMAEMKLDPIKLPIFDGQQENWLVFKDMFESLVHNRAEFDPTYKLSRLRQCIRADAVPTVAFTLGVTSSFGQSYNPRRLVEAHINRLLDLPELPSESQRRIRDVIDVVRSTLRALNVMGLPTDQWDAIMYPIILRKLPSATVAHWTIKSHSDKLPELQGMLEEVETYADTLRSDSMTQQRRQQPPRSAKSHMVTASVTNAAARPVLNCPQCSEPHRLMKCQQFRSLAVDQRLHLARQGSLCFNCLSPGHTARECSSGLCHICKQKHNTLLCKTAPLEKSSGIPNSGLRTSAGTTTMSATSDCKTGPQVLPRVDAVQTLLAQSDDIVLLATAIAPILNGCGEERKCRILCDMGSQVSFVTESLFNELNLPRNRKELVIEGIGAQDKVASRGQATLTMRSLYDPELSFDVHILPTIPSNIPAVPVDASIHKHLEDLPLADSTIHIPGPIEVLVGADVWGMLLCNGVVTNRPGQPSALQTRLGWVVLGPTSPKNVALPALRNCTENANEDRLDYLLERFWLQEEVSPTPPKDDDCEAIFRRTVSRDSEGRYVVQIPFHPEAPALGDPYRNALRQFLRVERRLHNEPDSVDNKKGRRALQSSQCFPKRCINLRNCKSCKLDLIQLKVYTTSQQPLAVP